MYELTAQNVSFTMFQKTNKKKAKLPSRVEHTWSMHPVRFCSCCKNRQVFHLQFRVETSHVPPEQHLASLLQPCPAFLGESRAPPPLPQQAVFTLTRPLSSLRGARAPEATVEAAPAPHPPPPPPQHPPALPFAAAARGILSSWCPADGAAGMSITTECACSDGLLAGFWQQR